MASSHSLRRIMRLTLKRCRYQRSSCMRGDDQIVPYADSGSVERKAAEERYLEDLEGLSAGHADDAGRHNQRRHFDFHKVGANRGAGEVPLPNYGHIPKGAV